MTPHGDVSKGDDEERKDNEPKSGKRKRGRRGAGTTRTTPAPAALPSPSAVCSPNSVPTSVLQPHQTQGHPKTASRKTHWRRPNSYSGSDLGCVVALLQSVHIHVSTDVGDVMVADGGALGAHREARHGADEWRVGIAIDASEAAQVSPLLSVQAACFRFSRDRGMQ